MQTWKSTRNHLGSDQTLPPKSTKRTLTRLAVRVLLQSKKSTDLKKLPQKADYGLSCCIDWNQQQLFKNVLILHWNQISKG